MRVQVRRCPFTGKIFEETDLRRYVLHLEAQRAAIHTRIREDAVRNSFQRWLNVEKSKLLNVSMIPEWFLDNQEKIKDAANAILFDRNSRWERSRMFVPQDRFAKLEWEHARYNALCSNSHECPDNGVTNWGSNPNLPTGYPGWTGYLKGSLVRPKNAQGYPYSEALRVVGIKTGSGGGGNESFGYSFTLFLADWPGLNDQVRQMEEDAIISKLKGNK